MKKETELEKCQKKLKEMEHSWKRALADYKNLEKRNIEDKQQTIFYIKKETINQILPILDNLERLQHHTDDKGLEMIIKEMQTVFKEMGLVEISLEGSDFDPNTMEAVETQEGEKNKVLKILLKGYLLGTKLIRPAKVVVGNGGK